MCIARRDGAPHLGHHQLARRCERHRARWWCLGAGHQWRSYIPGRDQVSRFAPPRGSLPALGQPVLIHDARPFRHQVQQPGRGMFLPACQVHDLGELTWATAASVLVVPQVLVNSQYPNPCKTGRIIRCDLQTRIDLVFHVAPSWRASPKIAAPSKRSCRIAQRIARIPNAPGEHTPRGSAQ